jgi:hypothetical protein
MREFEISVQAKPGGPPDAPAAITISAGEVVLTRLIRQGANIETNALEAPPAQLAFWLADNWWRLRHECVPPTGPTGRWRMAHELSSMPAYAWPRLAFWGEGDRIGLSSRADPAGTASPVQYLINALSYVKAAVFEDEVDRFLLHIADERAGLASDWAALRSQIDALNRERTDPDIAEWRKLEAQLGYDIDQAPDALIKRLVELRAEYGGEAISEAALAVQGEKAAEVLLSELAVANDNGLQCYLNRTAALVGNLTSKSDEAPWVFGERAARMVRAVTGHVAGPLRNKALAEILHVPEAALARTYGARTLAYGIRVRRRNADIVAPFSRWAADRRFEFSRALGDVIWSRNENLGPITQAKSERQKFQRAFAQSLLCPYDALRAYIGDDMSDGALTAAAKYFHVSDRLVRSLLVNKNDLERWRLPMHTTPVARSEYDSDPAELDEVSEAA